MNTAAYPAEIQTLPVFPCLDDICRTLKKSPSRFLVLTAETAAGKSTAVPFALLRHFPGKIIMLEPRRLATLAIASRIAALLNEKPGQTAGYRMRFETRVSNDTRIEIVTEAVFTGMLQNDPALEGVSAVILDEFHERSVHADLALAFLKETMQLRDDLFAVVMSATIDTERIASFLQAPVFSVPGRRFPVSISYMSDFPAGTSVAEKAAAAVRRELSDTGGKRTGSILVFLPGIREIRKTEYILTGKSDSAIQQAEILVLHSSISFDEQKKILSPPENTGRRRVILSSSIAETSVTVPDVTCVIDSGLARITRFNIPNGMYALCTETESVFSADQRTGRAGRTAPGTCIRLWAEHDVRVAELPPEITRSDLMPAVLECARWGVSDMHTLEWLDAPNAASWNTAQSLLKTMGCLDSGGHITERGTYALTLGTHPRIAAMILAACETAPDTARIPAQVLDTAARLNTGIANQKETAAFKSDMLRRIHHMPRRTNSSAAAGHADNQTGTNRKTEKAAPALPEAACFTAALLAGFPDRLARHTENGSYQFPSGRFALLPQAVRDKTNAFPQWIIATDADAGERTGRIYAYEIPDLQTAEKWIASHASVQTVISFESGSRSKLRKTERVSFGKLMLKERRLVPDKTDIARAYCTAVKTDGLGCLPDSDDIQSFLLRAKFYFRYAKHSGENPTAENFKLLCETPEEWLLPFIPPDGMLPAQNVLDALRLKLNGSAVDRDVPVSITLPNKKKRRIHYEETENGIVPVLEAVIQEIFGCKNTPEIMGVPVLLRLLSPARRPLQVTRDLSGFWQNTWPQICKEMKGRYPKHNWNPEIME